MQFKDCGIIRDIDSSKFFGDGCFYINEDLTDAFNDKRNILEIIKEKMHNFSFEAKTQQIFEEIEGNREYKDMEKRSVEIAEVFKKLNGKVIDIVFFPDNGFRGTDKVILEENSIFYIKIYENIKLGFFINKTLARFLFGGDFK